MYICLCKGITEKQLQEAIGQRKNMQAKDILKILGLGSDCGTCIDEAIQNVLEQTRAPNQMKESLNKS